MAFRIFQNSSTMRRIRIFYEKIIREQPKKALNLLRFKANCDYAEAYILGISF